IKPRAFMNNSGPAVKRAMEKWCANVGAPGVLVVSDDFALPWGRLRLRRSGSAGGHNGLKSVIESLGSQDFPRLRVGVGPVPEHMDAKEYVLKHKPLPLMTALAESAASALDFVLSHGLESAMNRFNAAGDAAAS